MDLVSTTALMEYMDMLFTRLAIAAAKHEDLRWWIEVHPPDMASGIYRDEEDRGKVGYIQIKGMTATKITAYRADFAAVQKGHRAGADALEVVVDHHISKFMKRVLT